MKSTRGYGGGHIRRRVLKSGKERFDVLVKVEGKQKTLASTSTEEKALAYIAAHAAERLHQGKFVPDDIGVITLRHLGEMFLAALPESRLETDKSRWKARIAETAEFIDYPLTQIGEPAVRRWIDTMARTKIATGKSRGKRPARSTLQNPLNLLRGVFRWGVIHGYLFTNPAERVTIRGSTITAPRTGGLGEAFDYLREGEVKKLLGADLPPAQKTAFTLLALTGARPKDLYLLTWDRVDVRGATIMYRTHKKHRNYPAHLLPQAHEAIRTWWLARGQPATGLVFPGPKGLPHTKGSQASLHASAIFLGHADLNTVRRYAVALGIAAKKAVEESRVSLASKRKERS